MEHKKRQRQNGKRRKRNLEAGIWATMIMLIFRIPLANLLGDEGNGYLAISWEIYGLFTLVFGYGYSKAASQMVKSRVEKNLYQNSLRSMKTVLLTGLLSSMAGAALLYFFASAAGTVLFGTRLVEISLKLFAPLLVLATVLGILRGYFEGMGTTVPTQISRLVEALVMATGSVLFAFITMGYGKKVGALLHDEHFEAGFGAAGVVIGYLLGAFLAILFLCFVDILYKKAYSRLLKKDAGRSAESKRGLLKEIFASLGLGILPVLFIRLYRIVNLYLYGQQRLKGEDAVSGIRIIGSFYGKVSVLMALSVAVILFLAEERKRSQKQPVFTSGFRTLKLVMGDELQKLIALALPIMGTFIVLSEALLKALYGNGEWIEYTLLGIGGVSLLCISFGVYLYHILQEMQMEKPLLVLQLGAFLLQTLAMLFFRKLPVMGEFPLSELSLGLAELIFWLALGVGELLLLIRVCRLRLPWRRIFLPPLLQTFVMIIVEVMIVQVLNKKLPYWAVCILAIVVGGIFHQLTKKVPLLNRE